MAVINKNRNENIIKNAKTGDVLKAKSEFLPFIYHYVIVKRTDDEFVIFHNDPHKTNLNGGNIIREDFVEWISGKEIVEVIETSINEITISNIVKELKESKFDVLKFNCEHFVSKLNLQRPISPQILNWTIILAAIYTTFVIFKRYKK